MSLLHSLFSKVCIFLLAFTMAHAANKGGSPAPLGGASDYENSTWVEDWTENLDTSYYIANLPRGVNTINVFVGQLTFVGGIPTVNGYALDTPGLPQGTGAFPNTAALADFVKQCKAAGCAVKLSIGGQAGTQFGNSWVYLNADILDAYSHVLLNLCNDTGADGIDFDYELSDTNLATFAGQLAGKLKDLNSNLATSCCVLAGCDDSGPWSAADVAFLSAAVTAQGWCAIDRVYVMAYYDYCPLSQNEQFMLSWNTWLATQHGFSAPRISAGVDPNDPNTSPNDGSLQTWISFAQQNGFSTAIWDQQGVYDYVTNDWGTVVRNLYSASAVTAQYHRK